ncbi:unnamed protein product [Paramecium pentaurelia]|uniref:Uncharacterized protein n=1 Tax=Paramecium pentaurelia TaxID=43138 RepID=A0A8S1YNY8_9CILI|nr:unnamed protein product [Paramecium pentaurelia]
MLCRIIFFIIVIYLRDLRDYSQVELILYVIIWLLFHLYIQSFQQQYFSKSESKILN